MARGGQSLILDHYLEVLPRKPGALPGATALAQARAVWRVHPGARGVLGAWPGPGSATPPAPGRWSRCCCCTAGCLPPTCMAGMTAAMRLGNLSPDVVAVEARNAGSRPDPGPVPLALVLPRRVRRARRRGPAAGDRAADRPAAAAHRAPSTTSCSPSTPPRRADRAIEGDHPWLPDASRQSPPRPPRSRPAAAPCGCRRCGPGSARSPHPPSGNSSPTWGSSPSW